MLIPKELPATYGIIFWTIYWNPDTWQNNANIKDATENSLLETAKYTLGLVKCVRG